jgi:hypothetical protein
MTTASLAPSTSARAQTRTRVSTARASVATLAKFAVLGWSALYVAYALRMVIAAGPLHLHEFVFVLGAITLVAAFAWVMPFVGALMLGSAGTAVWIFLDVTPANVWLAGAAYVAMALTMGSWVAESRQREA